MHIKTIMQLEGTLSDVYVIVRGSLNVPLKNGVVADTFRINRMLPTLEYLQSQGAKVVLMAHIGREASDSLLPVFEELKTRIPVQWGGSVFDPACREKWGLMQPGDILMVENLRQDEREKANDEGFTDLLAEFGRVYVNEAFDNVHRQHASMVGLPARLPAYAGLNTAKEIAELSSVATPDQPSLFILGGAKFETKLPLITKYLAIYDQVFVGGALANDVLKAKGYPVGKSLLSDITLEESLVEHESLLIPIDVTVESERGQRVCAPEEVTDDEVIKDAGPATVKMLQPYIKEAKTILWNGPLGQFEVGYRDITERVARLVADSSGYSVVGGGDTIASIAHLRLQEEFDWLSTGGGAMLTFLEDGTTPAIDFLRADTK